MDQPAVPCIFGIYDKGHLYSIITFIVTLGTGAAWSAYIRPTAVGKKNWLFVGGEGTGQTSAILYTLVESAKRHGHEPYAYLRDVLERLPAMKSSEIDRLLPGNWKPAGEPATLSQVA